MAEFKTVISYPIKNNNLMSGAMDDSEVIGGYKIVQTLDELERLKFIETVELEETETQDWKPRKHILKNGTLVYVVENGILYRWKATASVTDENGVEHATDGEWEIEEKVPVLDEDGTLRMENFANLEGVTREEFEETVEEINDAIANIKIDDNVVIQEINEDIAEIQAEVEPLTDEKIDELWEKTGVLPTASMPKEMNFAYHELSANTKHPIKRNGYYMCYSNSGNLNLCESDGTVVVGNAKQIQFMVAPLADNPTSTNIKACGIYWSGSSILSGVEGFRRTTDDGGYITANTEFYVCEEVRGD